MRLSEYLPSILRTIDDFRVLAEIEQPEFDDANRALDDAFDDFLFERMGLGAVEAWEEALRLDPEPGDTLDTRRTAIKAMMASRLPITYRTLLAYLHGIAEDSDALLQHNDYIIAIRTPLLGGSLRAVVRRMLRMMIPANLIIQYFTRIDLDLVLTVAATMVVHRRFSLRDVPDIQAVSVEQTVAVMSGIHRKITILEG